MKKIFLWVAFVFAILFLAVRGFSEENRAYYEIAVNMGYTDVEHTPYEIADIEIPETFNDVYKRYNALQKSGGYDLFPYRGKKCKRYTYLIPSLDVRANILVKNGKIIGGDISGIRLDSIMIPLCKSKEK